MCVLEQVLRMESAAQEGGKACREGDSRGWELAPHSARATRGSWVCAGACLDVKD